MSKRSQTRLVEPTRWSVTVSRETDQALRTLLASRGVPKGGLSRFVEDAVNREVLREIANDIQARNADRDPSEVDQIIDAELREMRETFWSDPRT